MSDLLFIVFSVSVLSFLVLSLMGVIQLIKKNKVKSKNHFKLSGVSFLIMIICFLMVEPTPDEPDEVESTELGSNSEISSNEKTSETLNENQTDEEESNGQVSSKVDENKDSEESMDHNTNTEVAVTVSPFQKSAIENAEKYSAGPGKMLYGSDFKGLPYFFEGEVIKIITIEFNETALVKNANGYVMPINTFENLVEVGQVIKVYGNLSGDGYANADLGVDNVVGMTGYINASIIE